MLKLTNLRVALDDDRPLKAILARQLKTNADSISNMRVLHKAVDARRKSNISFIYNLLFETVTEKEFLKKRLSNKNLSLFEEKALPEIVYGNKVPNGEIVVAGAGPAGLICALVLAQNGYKPLLLERGMCVADRKAAVDAFWQTGQLSSDGNVQFGEGGAGTFSDGKLTTRVNDPASKLILDIFAKAGAPEEIKYEHKPHIGTDILHVMTKNLSKMIQNSGGRISYLSKVDDIILEKNKIRKILLADGAAIDCAALVLAIGHSARDTYQMLFGRGFDMQAKPFSVGVRIEHPQAIIDKAQYGVCAGHPKLGAADYALVYHDKAKKRSAYSFCMCPGGVVVAAASEPKQVVTNGMSHFKRASGIANSALVVGVGPDDFGGHPLSGIAFQRKFEELAYLSAGSNYCAPAQTVGSFLKASKPVLGSLLQQSYQPGVVPVSLSKVLPDFVSETLMAALPDFGRKIKEFDNDEALLTGVETRTSAPCRVLRDNETRQALGIDGVYPAGEGAGYAGGIMSAALDGYYTAFAVMKEFKQPKDN